MIQENISIPFYDGKKRVIRVLLPDYYKEAKRKFSVLYMFDGQNLFNSEDSYTGVTWEIQEALEGLLKTRQAEPMIVVGIDHAEANRLQEYGPFPMEYEGQMIQGQGRAFGEFLIKELIPYLESRYPIEIDASKRFLAGSSMGGLMTTYLSLAYPAMFAKVGVFSLCSWISKPDFTDFVKKMVQPKGSQYFIQVGGREGLNPETGQENKELSKTYLQDTMDFVEQLVEAGYERDDIQLSVGQDDWHSESCWQKYMVNFITWLQQS